jgi:hypothetical protein
MQLELFMELLQSYHGPNLLRMKGIVKMDDDPSRPMVLHGVQHVMHPPERLSLNGRTAMRPRGWSSSPGISSAPNWRTCSRPSPTPITGGAEAFSDDTLSLRRGG